MSISTLSQLRKAVNGYWAERTLAQIDYAQELSKTMDGKYDGLISRALAALLAAYDEEKTITKSAAQAAEHVLSDMAAAAKQYEMICVSHAHIDMNWMWRFDETVAITLDTFETMLRLMEEYPKFTFSQSQASVYKIVEDHAPDMLEEIKTRVHEGRWEVSASTWVETDKNMPSGESLARHILYTKRYLSRLLDLDPDTLRLDYEPDTFGHSLNVPEILASGGVEFYYHCRGADDENIYRWEAPSGRSILVYREPLWYNAAIEPKMASYVPGFCTKYGMKTMLKVYGVGDHGGGPTRRDIERILDMQEWPVFPSIRFGTYAEYYQQVRAVADKLPVVRGERNFIFTGCYTSQSRIKMANRVGEAALNESEALSALASVKAGRNYNRDGFFAAWRNLLFNQFHDIIPGSGVIDTREHAMGLFQNALAVAGTEKTQAMRGITKQINTAAMAKLGDISDTVSEGAGVGFGVDAFGVSQTSRGAGINRVFTVFNSALCPRSETVEVIVWDWQGDTSRLVVKDESGDEVPHQLLEAGTNHYWGHTYVKLLIQAEVRSCGYSTYLVTEDPNMEPRKAWPLQPRVERRPDLILENDQIKATFDSVSLALLSLVDKSTGQELIDKKRSAAFRLIQEDPGAGMTSWIVGTYASVEPLVKNAKFKNTHKLVGQFLHKPELRQVLAYEIEFERSKLEVTVSLDKGSRSLRFDVECDWHEVGKPGRYVPQLNFFAPVSYNCSAYKYDVPFGTIERPSLNMDVPANSFAVALGQQAKAALMVTTDSKYGFRGVDNGIGVSLIRSSFDPDPYPEYGIHRFTLNLSAVSQTAPNKQLIQHAYNLNHPLTPYSASIQAGSLPLSDSLIRLEEGGVAVSSVKMLEDGEDSGQTLLVRLYAVEGKDTGVRLRTGKSVQKAFLVDINENPVDGEVTVDGDRVSCTVGAGRIVNLCISLA